MLKLLRLCLRKVADCGDNSLPRGSFLVDFGQFYSNVNNRLGYQIDINIK